MNVRFLSILSLTLLYFCHAADPVNTHCLTVTGTASEKRERAVSFAACDAYYVLTSCGIESTSLAPNAIDGTWVTDNICYARNGGTNAAVKAKARCCLIDPIPWHYGAKTVNSGGSSSADDASIASKCNSVAGELLVGCSVYSNGRGIDGSYPTDDQQCVARKGGSEGGGVYARARCVNYWMNPDKFQCQQVQGEISGNAAGALSTVSCPSGWYMSGCSGYSAWLSVDSWYIDGNDRCVARNAMTLSSGEGVWAHGICCQRFPL